MRDSTLCLSSYSANLRFESLATVMIQRRCKPVIKACHLDTHCRPQNSMNLPPYVCNPHSAAARCVAYNWQPWTIFFRYSDRVITSPLRHIAYVPYIPTSSWASNSFSAGCENAMIINLRTKSRHEFMYRARLIPSRPLSYLWSDLILSFHYRLGFPNDIFFPDVVTKNL